MHVVIRQQKKKNKKSKETEASAIMLTKLYRPWFQSTCLVLWQQCLLDDCHSSLVLEQSTNKSSVTIHPPNSSDKQSTSPRPGKNN